VKEEWKAGWDHKDRHRWAGTAMGRVGSGRHGMGAQKAYMAQTQTVQPGRKVAPACLLPARPPARPPAAATTPVPGRKKGIGRVAVVGGKVVGEG